MKYQPLVNFIIEEHWDKIAEYAFDNFPEKFSKNEEDYDRDINNFMENCVDIELLNTILGI